MQLHVVFNRTTSALLLSSTNFVQILDFFQINRSYSHANISLLLCILLFKLHNIYIIQEIYGASGAIRTPNVLEENPDLQSGAANHI